MRRGRGPRSAERATCSLASTGRPVCSPTFNAGRGARCRRTCTPPRPIGRIGREPDERVRARAGPGRPRAAQRIGLHRSAARCRRHGLRRGRGGHRPVRACPGRIPRTGWTPAWRPARLVADGRGRAGRPPAAAGRRPAVPGALLAAGGAGPPRSCSSASPPTRRTSIASGSRPRLRPALPGEPDRGARDRTGSGWPPPSARSARVTRAGRRAGHRQDHHGGPAAGPAQRPARPAAADRPGRTDRQGRRPAGRGRARARPRSCSSRGPAAARRRLGARPLHRLLGWLPGRRAGSATTRTTSCRTTSWSSTRCRWSR